MCKEQKSKLNDDLISRQDVIEEIALHDHTNGTEPYFSGHEAIEILKCVPTVTHAKRTETHGVCSDRISRQAVMTMSKWQMVKDIIRNIYERDWYTPYSQRPKKWKWGWHK